MLTTRSRVLIADDHTLLAEALKGFLTADFDVVGTVNDGRALLHMAQTLAPDAIVADVGMPVLNGLDATQRLKRILPNVKVIFVSVNREPEVIAEAFRCGASAYLVKTAAANELVTAIRCALSGKAYLSSALFKSVLELIPQFEVSSLAHDGLTERQVEVLQLLAEGRSMKEAGAVLNLTTRTVAFHKYRIMESLRLRNDAEIVQYAIREHILFS